MHAVNRTRSRSSRILLVLDECHTGEALRVMPYVKAVRVHFPDAHIVLLTNEHVLRAFGQEAPYDRVVISGLYGGTYASKRDMRMQQARAVPRLIRDLGIGYDLVIYFWWGTTLLHALGFIVAPRGRRIGFSQRFPQLLTSQLGSFNDGDQMGQHIALLREAGIEVDRLPPSISYSKADTDAVDALLKEYGLARSHGIIIAHPGSDWACQQWLPERWAALADALVTRYGADIVFTGVDSEVTYIERIRQRMRSPSTSLAGRTTLPHLAALLARAQLCVCVDSAVYELTQVVAVPTVVLAGSTSPCAVAGDMGASTVLNLMTPPLRAAINSCRVSANEAGIRRYLAGGCLNYDCSMAGLQDISVHDVLSAVSGQAELTGLGSRR